MLRAHMHFTGCFFTALILTACAAEGPAQPASAPAETAAPALTAHLKAIEAIKTLQADFVCEKDLAMLDSPLVSRGRVTIGKPDSVRFSTLKPYVSELILHQGKVLQKSQHETEWTKTDQSARPGLNTIMGQLAGWAVGNGGKISDSYDVAWSEKAIKASPDATGSVKGADTFLLTPTNKDLQKVIKQLTIAFDPATHHLLAVQFVTQPGDTTTYWFGQPVIDGELPADIFTPKVN